MTKEEIEIGKYYNVYDKKDLSTPKWILWLHNLDEHPTGPAIFLTSTWGYSGIVTFTQQSAYEFIEVGEYSIEAEWMRRCRSKGWLVDKPFNYIVEDYNIY